MVTSPSLSRPAVFFRALRPRQWVKNLIVLLGAAGAGVLFDVSVLPRLVLLGCCFSLVASGLYLYNDVCDVETDRLDPRKASRPVVSGLLSPGHALRLAVVLVLCGTVTGLLLDRGAGFVLGLYVVITVLYSWRLKHVPVLEVLMVASGFVARAAAGAIVADVTLSGWFLPLVATVAVFVVLVKRSGELREGRSQRPVLAAYNERVLTRTRLAVLVLVLVLYAGWVSTAAEILAAAVSFPLLAASLLRVNASVSAGAAAAPDELVFRDPLLLGLAAAWFACFLIAVG